MNVIGMTINNIAFILLWIFFVQSVGVIHGWTAFDIIGLQGFVALSYGVVLSVAMGIRKLPEYVSSGVFDRFLLSPKNVLVRVATSAFGPSAVGDVIFGIVCLGIYATFLPIHFVQMILGFMLIIVSILVFFSCAIITFSVSFYFIDAQNVANGIFEIFFTPALFHGGVFQGVTRFVYTFLIPSLLIGILPVEIVRDTSLSQFALISCLSLMWLVLSVKIFNRAVRKYESANYMTFGS
jgi:ABC-2 type transport system permease protein